MDGRLKSKKEIEGLNKVAKKNYEKKDGNESYAGDAGKKEAEMVQKIIEKVRMSQMSKNLSWLTKL